MRMLRKFPEHWIKDHDLKTLRYLFLAGEPLDEATWNWTSKTVGVPVIDHYWQTESGWPMISNMPGVELLKIKPGSPTKPVMGWNLDVVDERGNPVKPEYEGFSDRLPAALGRDLSNTLRRRRALRAVLLARLPRETAVPHR